jgi:hypothetical protein
VVNGGGNAGGNAASNEESNAAANVGANAGTSATGTGATNTGKGGGIVSGLVGGLKRLFAKRQLDSDAAEVTRGTNLTTNLGNTQGVGSGSNAIQAGTTLATTISIAISLTAIPPQGTTISTAAAITFSINPTTTLSPPPVPITSPTAVASVINSPLPAPPGMCILFFAPFTGNLTVCPAGKVSLQYPTVMIGSNRYGGLGPCAQYPNGVPGGPIFDQQFGPIGL